MLTLGCRTTCLKKNIVGHETLRAQNRQTGRALHCCRSPGAAAASSGNIVKLVLDPAVSPATVMESVWTEPTELDFVSVTEASMEPPVRRVRVASMVSTVIRVCSPPVHQTSAGSSPAHSGFSVGLDCTCRNGRCHEGLSGDGTCECDVGWRGVLCDESMTSHLKQ